MLRSVGDMVDRSNGISLAEDSPASRRAQPNPDLCRGTNSPVFIWSDVITDVLRLVLFNVSLPISGVWTLRR